MSKRARASALSLIVILTSACGVAVRATPFSPGQYAARPAEAPVQMFSTKVPECAYEELGLLRAEPRSGFTRWQSVVDEFLERVRRMGGDGVILRQGVELRASGEGEVVTEEVLSGTVIRFERDECRR